MWSLKASPRELLEEFLILTLSQDKVNHNCFITYSCNFRHCYIPSYEKYLTVPPGEDLGHAWGWGDECLLSGHSYPDLPSSLDPET